MSELDTAEFDHFAAHVRDMPVYEARPYREGSGRTDPDPRATRESYRAAMLTWIDSQPRGASLHGKMRSFFEADAAMLALIDRIAASADPFHVAWLHEVADGERSDNRGLEGERS